MKRGQAVRCSAMRRCASSWWRPRPSGNPSANRFSCGIPRLFESAATKHFALSSLMESDQCRPYACHSAGRSAYWSAGRTIRTAAALGRRFRYTPSLMPGLSWQRSRRVGRRRHGCFDVVCWLARFCSWATFGLRSLPCWWSMGWQCPPAAPGWAASFSASSSFH